MSTLTQEFHTIMKRICWHSWHSSNYWEPCMLF